MIATLKAFGLIFWPIIKPLVGPFLGYLKGSSDKKKSIENRTMKRTTRDVEKANEAARHARDRSNAGKLRDSDYRD